MSCAGFVFNIENSIIPLTNICFPKFTAILVTFCTEMVNVMSPKISTYMRSKHIDLFPDLVIRMTTMTTQWRTVNGSKKKWRVEIDAKPDPLCVFATNSLFSRIVARSCLDSIGIHCKTSSTSMSISSGARIEKYFPTTRKSGRRRCGNLLHAPNHRIWIVDNHCRKVIFRRANVHKTKTKQKQNKTKQNKNKNKKKDKNKNKNKTKQNKTIFTASTL